MYVCVCVRVCICERVGLYVCVGFFIVPGGYGFGKANLGLRALGPCQTHQPISYAIRYRTTTASMHTCANMQHHPPTPHLLIPFLVHSHSFISDFSSETHCMLEPVTACVSRVVPITESLIHCARPPPLKKVLTSTITLIHPKLAGHSSLREAP